MEEPVHGLNIREMLRGNLVRLRYVNRYSTCRVNHKETVAEHSYFVCVYAVLVGQWYEFWHVNPLNWRKLMAKASLHDVEESRSGDWPRPFKHSDATLRHELERVAAKAMSQVLGELLEGPWREQLQRVWENAKDDSPEGLIVSFADFLSVLSYVTQELESGNKFAVEHVEVLAKYFEEFGHHKYQFIRPLVNQTAQVLKEIRNGQIQR